VATSGVRCGDMCSNARLNTPRVIVASGLPSSAAVLDLSIELQVAMILDARRADARGQDTDAIAHLLGRSYARVTAGSRCRVAERLTQRVNRLLALAPLTILVLTDACESEYIARRLRESLGASAHVKEYPRSSLPVTRTKG